MHTFYASKHGTTIIILARVSRRTPSDIKVRQVKGRVTHKQNKTDSTNYTH